MTCWCGAPLWKGRCPRGRQHAYSLKDNPRERELDAIELDDLYRPDRYEEMDGAERWEPTGWEGIRR